MQPLNIYVSVDIPDISNPDLELVTFLNNNGGFYYTRTFPTTQELQDAVVKRKDTTYVPWTSVYKEPLLQLDSSSHIFISDMSLFEIYESSDWPFMPVVSLSFNKVVSKYNILDFILFYQLHIRNELVQKTIRTCSKTYDQRVMGIQYTESVCLMDPIYFDQTLKDGQYTYVIGIHNNEFKIGYKEYLHANEIGSKHYCILKAFDPQDKIIMAGEIIVHNGIKTFNILSGSVSRQVIVQTLDTIINSTYPTDYFFNEESKIIGRGNALHSWWIPLLKYIFGDAVYTSDILFTPITIVSEESVSQLCTINAENMHEFGSMNLCDRWQSNEQVPTYTQSLCHPEGKIRDIIGRKIIAALSTQKNVILSTVDTVEFKNGLIITSEVLNIGGYAVIMKGTYQGKNIIAKVGIDYAQKNALVNEIRTLSQLKDVDGLLLPLLIFIGDVNYIIFPYYNRGNLATYINTSDLNLYVNRVKLATHVGTHIITTLAQIHTHGFLHLDISFGNILIDDAMKIALTDMGISLPVDYFTGSRISKLIVDAGSGTPYESINIGKLIPPTPASDFESLGYVLYQIIYDVDLPWNNMSREDSIPLKEVFEGGILKEYFRIVRAYKGYDISSLLIKSIF